MGEGGDGDDFPAVAGGVEAAGDERSQQMRCRDRSAQESGHPAGVPGGVGEEHDRDDRTPVCRAHQSRGEHVPGQRPPRPT